MDIIIDNYTIYLIGAGFICIIQCTAWLYLKQLKGELVIERRYRKQYSNAGFVAATALQNVINLRTKSPNATVKNMWVMAKNGLERHNEILMQKEK